MVKIIEADTDDIVFTIEFETSVNAPEIIDALLLMIDDVSV